MTCDKFSPDTPVSSTNKTDRHDITEILLKVALNTINPSPQLQYREATILQSKENAIHILMCQLKYIENKTFVLNTYKNNGTIIIGLITKNCMSLARYHDHPIH